MNDFAEHLIEVAELLRINVDPVPLYEVKMSGAEGWSDPVGLDDLFDMDAVYRKKPRQVKVSGQAFDLPTLIEGNEYWAANIWAPTNPSKVTYTAANAALRHQAETGLLCGTKRAATDLAKAICYWLSEGGDK